VEAFTEMMTTRRAGVRSNVCRKVFARDLLVQVAFDDLSTPLHADVVVEVEMHPTQQARGLRAYSTPFACTKAAVWRHARTWRCHGSSR
jgi:hypothetical protein